MNSKLLALLIALGSALCLALPVYVVLFSLPSTTQDSISPADGKRSSAAKIKRLRPGSDAFDTVKLSLESPGPFVEFLTTDEQRLIADCQNRFERGTSVSFDELQEMRDDLKQLVEDERTEYSHLLEVPLETIDGTLRYMKSGNPFELWWMYKRLEEVVHEHEDARQRQLDRKVDE